MMPLYQYWELTHPSGAMFGAKPHSRFSWTEDDTAIITNAFSRWTIITKEKCLRLIPKKCRRRGMTGFLFGVSDPNRACLQVVNRGTPLRYEGLGLRPPRTKSGKGTNFVKKHRVLLVPAVSTWLRVMHLHPEGRCGVSVCSPNSDDCDACKNYWSSEGREKKERNIVFGKRYWRQRELTR